MNGQTIGMGLTLALSTGDIVILLLVAISLKSFVMSLKCTHYAVSVMCM